MKRIKKLIKNKKTKKLIKKIVFGPLAPIFSFFWIITSNLQLFFYNVKWKITKAPMPTKEEAELVRENVTFIYKSFQRKRQAKRLCKNLQKYYPGVRVIIADDSKKPLVINRSNVEVINLPFNIGLSRGLNCALNKVDTPYTVRTDDDHLLSPHTKIHEHLKYLMLSSDVDLISFLPYNSTCPKNWQTAGKAFLKETMAESPNALRTPHGTLIDNKYIVLGKTPNVFIARTDAFREIGYDDNIRMTDHFEFFFRAAGKIVSVLSLDSFVLHHHNHYKRRYRKYRGDIKDDVAYILKKHPSLRK